MAGHQILVLRILVQIQLRQQFKQIAYFATPCIQLFKKNLEFFGSIAQLVRAGHNKVVSLTYISYICCMNHITADKGDLGVAMVTADLIERGIPVFTPVSAASPFDLLIYHNDKYLRIQVKYRKMVNNIVKVVAERHTIVKGRVVNTRINDEFDILAIYCPDTKTCYYINREDTSKHTVLRFTTPKNNQVKGIKLAKDYTSL